MTIISCGSGTNNAPRSYQVNINPFKLSLGADTVLSVYNRLASGKACYDHNSKKMLWVTTMPVYCYLTNYHVGSNPDTAITFGTQYTTGVNTIDTNAFESLWSYIGWQTWGDCQPKTVSFPIDTAVDKTSSGEIHTWFVSQKEYQKLVLKIDPKYVRNTDTLFKAGLSYFSVKDITGISNWGIEDSTGFCAKKLPSSYANLFCAAGVTVKVSVKRAGMKDTSIDCYLVINNDLGTMRWKDSVVANP